MSNHMKKCGGRCCREGMHRDCGRYIMRRATRKFRHDAKEKLRNPDLYFDYEQGENGELDNYGIIWDEDLEPEPVFSVPYTD